MGDGRRPATTAGTSRTTERPDTYRTEILLALEWAVPLESRYRLARHAAALGDRVIDAADLAGTIQVPAAHIEEIRRLLRAGTPRLDGAQRRAEREEVRIVPYSSPDYPEGLRDLDLPPPCLFVRGTASLEVLNRPAIGIVGPRSADPYGLEATRHLAGELARAALVIGSGFARGVDATAHREAAENGAPTIAWLGCGVDVPYPRQNQRLIEPIFEAGGLLISEFDFGTQPAAWRFPLRNRLIAASTLGMLVTQASLRSGSLISARLALELGREVYAVPGRIFDARSKGTNLLLRDGAHVALHVDSVLDTLPLRIHEELQRLRTTADGAGGVVARLRRLFASGERAWSPEDLVAELELDELGPLLTGLSELELEGRLVREAGGFRARPEA